MRGMLLHKMLQQTEEIFKRADLTGQDLHIIFRAEGKMLPLITDVDIEGDDNATDR